MQFTKVPEGSLFNPIAGLGLPWSEKTVKVTVVIGVPTQFQVMAEFCVTVNVVEVPVPLAGTSPVPVQPLQLQEVDPSTTGLATLAVTCEPRVTELLPAGGVGLP